MTKLHQERLYVQNLKNYTKAIELNPNHANAHNNLGFLYLKIGDLAHAAATLKNALAILATPNLYILMNLGHVYFCEGKLEEAISLYRQSLDLFESPGTFFEMMEDDWQYLVQYGVERSVYDGLLADLQGKEE